MNEELHCPGTRSKTEQEELERRVEELEEIVERQNEYRRQAR
jgi:proteasome assembly chaperone (PAC2) family protein